MADQRVTLQELKDQIDEFAEKRQWSPYHSPKNLTMALASEVGELCEIFRWLSPAESELVQAEAELRSAVADELADIANIVMLLSVHTRIDLSEAIAQKMLKNAEKYPAPA